MSYKENIKDWVLKNVFEVKEETKRPQDAIAERQIFRQFEDLKELEDAIATAQNITNPQRTDLHRILDRVEEDPHLMAQWNTRKMKTIEREFKILNPNGEINEEWQERFNKPWFFDFMHEALDSLKRGYNAITFGAWNGETFTYYRDSEGRLHSPIENIPFRHIQPEYGELLKNDTDYRGFDLFKAPLSKKILYVGKPKDWGFLYRCATYILIKQNCILNWSEWAEIFAHDVRIGRTDAEGVARTRFAKSLRDLGSGSFGVFNTDDDIEYIGSNRKDAYSVYKELLEYIDKNVSEILFGQNVVMKDTGRVVGNVAENITDLYGEHDSKFLQYLINTELFPKMREMGINLPDITFDWDTSESLTLTERADIDLKISQMGKTIDNEYLEETYGTVLGEVDIASPEEVANNLRNMMK